MFIRLYKVGISNSPLLSLPLLSLTGFILHTQGAGNLNALKQCQRRRFLRRTICLFSACTIRYVGLKDTLKAHYGSNDAEKENL